MQSPPKAYDLRFELRDGYLYARIESPSITRAMALDYLGEIADKCAETRCRCLLIDRDIPAVMPTADALAAIGEFIRMSEGVRTAFVNRHGAVGAPLKNVIKAGSQTGAAVAYFTTIESAEAWLLGSDSRS